MSARLPLLLVVLVVLAGCNAPGAPAVDTDQPTVSESPAANVSQPTTGPSSNASTANSSTIPVEGGRLAADPDRTFRRVTRQLGVDARPPERITIVDPSEAPTSVDPPHFLQVLGMDANASRPGLAGQTIGEDWIRVNRTVATRPRMEGVLAHEYVHVVQNQQGVTGQLFASGVWESVPPFSVERPLLVSAVKEGAATYVATQYQRNYTEMRLQATRYGRSYRQQETAAGRYFMAPYWFGYRYVADRLADDETLDAIYDRPPRTSEALLHRYAPGAEPPVNLSVTVEPGAWRADKRGRVGELGTRLALAATLNTSRAVAGADGWGNDELVIFERNETRGYVWVTRWDDAANETEFRTALTAALDRQGTRTDAGWRDGTTAFRVRQGDDRTTVVVAGPSAFVRTASASVGQQVVVRGP
ncbi:hypothetical protein ACFR9U_05775 [Halorientalis brevis]|uniref:DUF4157 domain-containing protein n=1 Tax=Halorientalis brevis TaxID=1126241 RepID=A0ABD6C854_9EURY|nr:hypothetical protein [Halorientalis brevis]